MIQPSILPGMMELLPEDQILFNKIKSTIEDTFKKYAFYPLDTPIMEKMDILLAKGGGETQKQIYRLDKKKPEIGLRFDLTVPLARYVAQYFSELNFPFRRYHIGKVYRGERNQKGRYREFYQCDVDIIGHNNLAVGNDAEIPTVMAEIFEKLNLDYIFHYNNRKVMNGYLSSLGISDYTPILRAIDKMHKIGQEAVRDEFLNEGLEEQQIEGIFKLMSIQGENEGILEELKSLEVSDDLFSEGVKELEVVYRKMLLFGIDKDRIKIDLSITRGLDYYTGSVFETFLVGHEEIGSICSGGRYDDLASNYTKQVLPGIGLSIGLTRLFYQLKEESLIKIEGQHPTDVLILPMEGYEDHGIEVLNKLRHHGIIGQIYLEGGKMKKQFSYANNIKVPYVIIIGEDEAKNKAYSFKNMETGKQTTESLDSIRNKIVKQ